MLRVYVMTNTTLYVRTLKRICITYVYIYVLISLLECGFDLPTPGSVVKVSSQCRQLSTHVFKCRHCLSGEATFPTVPMGIGIWVCVMLD